MTATLNGDVDQLREALGQRDNDLEVLAERIADLELALEDVGWERALFEGEREFSRDGLERIAQLSRLMYLKNPLVQRAINVQAFYTWAQGVEISAVDEQVNEILQRFLSDPGNRRVLFDHQARLLVDVDLGVEGNLFLALFTTKTGHVRVRVIEPNEVRAIHCNPEDRSEPWWYERHYAQGAVQRKVLYRHWRYTAPGVDPRPEGTGAKEDETLVVLHVRSGGLRSMRFGVPETYAALDWARAYKGFLEDWATLVKSLSRFAWRAVTKNSKLAAAKTKLSSTLSPGSAETNPMPPAGGVFLSDGQADLTPIGKTGATTSAEDGKQLRLMVASAMNIPDTILSGDVDQGNLATAKTLDRPTELAFRSRQLLWADVLADVCWFVLRAAVIAGRLAGAVVRDEDGIETLELGELSDEVSVQFPPILEQDVVASVTALVTAAPHIPARFLAEQLLIVLGADNVAELLELLEEDRDEAAAAGVAGEVIEALREIAEAAKAA